MCVAHQGELATPGEFVLREVAGESLIAVRGADGTVRAFYNVCRHRGSRICEVARGRFPSVIRCVHHNWTYELDGRLRGAPHSSDVPDFDADALALRQVAAGVWEGLIFVSLAPPEPLEAACAQLQAEVAPLTLPMRRAARSIEYDVAANWKLPFENYAEDHGRTRFYSIFPNLFVGLHPDYAMVHTLWPEGPARTRIQCDWLFLPEASGRDDFRPDDTVAFWDKINRQNWHACELSQLGVAVRSNEPGSIAAVFDREYLRAMVS